VTISEATTGGRIDAPAGSRDTVDLRAAVGDSVSVVPDARPGPDAVAERLQSALLGALDLCAVYLGDQLGWYACLAEQGPSTSEMLARRTGTDARMCREWCEQQAITGLLDVVETPTQTRRYALPPSTARALLDPDGTAFSAPLSSLMAAAAGRMADVVEACRRGGGVDRDEHQALARECQASLNRPWYEQRLAEALERLPRLHALLSRPGAMIADIGCGAGWSSVALAVAYPEAQVQGFDIHAGTVERARELVRGRRLEPRVTFTVADAAELPAGRFDVVMAFEALHDLPHPVEVLAAARRALRPGGCVVVMDERVGDRFSAPGDDVERFSYGLSLMLSLPDALAHPGSEATGTVMRRPTLETYAARAGFSACDPLPVEGFGRWRFYRLDP